MLVQSITVGPFQENCYLVADPAAGEAVLVDPGDHASKILAAVEASGCAVRAIWLTHAHIDHVGAITPVKRVHDVPVYLHPLDRPLYDRALEQGLYYGIRIEPLPAPDRELAEGDVLAFGALSFNVIHVPGHAPGHVAFVGQGVVFGGDCLFMGSVGRTDLPLSDPRALERSLERFSTMPEETVVYPGHGPATTIGAENRTNPFLTGAVRLIKR